MSLILVFLTTITIAIFVFFAVRSILILKSKYEIDQYVSAKFPYGEDNKEDVLLSVPFEYLGIHKELNLNTFDLDFVGGNTEEEETTEHQLRLETKDGGHLFELYANVGANPIVSRTCPENFVFINGGCSLNGDCLGKGSNEFVGSSFYRHLVYECDGQNGILKVYHCRDSGWVGDKHHHYCKNENLCFAKKDGTTPPPQLTPKLAKSYEYFVCKNNLLTKSECKHDEFYDSNNSKCKSVPEKCNKLDYLQSVVVLTPLNKWYVCTRDEYGVNLTELARFETGKTTHVVGNCDSKKDTDTAVIFNDGDDYLWRVSEFYMTCSDDLWTIRHCQQDSSSSPPSPSTGSRDKLLEEIRKTLPDAILFTLPLIQASVFDETLQKCVPFSYEKHFKDGRVPLLYDEQIFEQNSIEHMPVFEYKIDEREKRLATSNNSKTIKNTENLVLSGSGDAYVVTHATTPQRFTEDESEKCASAYIAHYKSEFLGVYHLAFDNVILTCRFKTPINKMLIVTEPTGDSDPSDTSYFAPPNVWTRRYNDGDSYKDRENKVFRCTSPKTLHKFIHTCVDKQCTRVDINLPPNFESTMPTFGTNYKHSTLTQCDREGNYISSRPILREQDPFLFMLKQYCKGGRGRENTKIVHPLFNLPIECKGGDGGTEGIKIVSDTSARRLNTLFIEPTSIFKDDKNALDLIFFPGSVGE